MVISKIAGRGSIPRSLAPKRWLFWASRKELAMQFMWTVTIEDILEAQALARERGKKAGESYEAEFLEVMEKKGQKPACATELTHDELLAQYAENDKTILDISHNAEGEQTLRVIKKKDKN